jgi:hypothetical protein
MSNAQRPVAETQAKAAFACDAGEVAGRSREARHMTAHQRIIIYGDHHNRVGAGGCEGGLEGDFWPAGKENVHVTRGEFLVAAFISLNESAAPTRAPQGHISRLPFPGAGEEGIQGSSTVRAPAQAGDAGSSPAPVARPDLTTMVLDIVTAQLNELESRRRRAAA